MPARLLATIMVIFPGVVHAQVARLPEISIGAQSEAFLR